MTVGEALSGLAETTDVTLNQWVLGSSPRGCTQNPALIARAGFLLNWGLFLPKTNPRILKLPVVEFKNLLGKSCG